MSIGLTKVGISDGGQSMSVSLSDSLGAMEETWVAFGTLTWWLGLLTILGCGAAAAVQFGKLEAGLPVWRVLTVLAGVGLFCGFLFLVLRPSEIGEPWGTGLGFPLYLLGAGGVMAIGIMQWAAAASPIQITTEIEDREPLP